MPSSVSPTEGTKPQKPSDEEKTSVAPQRPPGFNKRCRDQAKLCLLVTSSFLLANANGMALWSAGASLLCLKRAKLWSTKNLKWSTLGLISKGVAGLGYYIATWYYPPSTARYLSNRSNSRMSWIDSYSLVSGAWGAILGCFLASTYVQEYGVPEDTSEYIQSAFGTKQT